MASGASGSYHARIHPSRFPRAAACGERPCSIADLILWQRTQSGLSVISATHSRGRHPLGFFAYYRIKVPCACAASFIEMTLRNPPDP